MQCTYAAAHASAGRDEAADFIEPRSPPFALGAPSLLSILLKTHLSLRVLQCDVTSRQLM